MTYEQMIEELKKLKTHNNKFTIEQQAEIDANVNAEVAEIDATIEIYNEKIAQLEAKLADESNYLYNNENEERDLTIELLIFCIRKSVCAIISAQYLSSSVICSAFSISFL